MAVRADPVAAPDVGIDAPTDVQAPADRGALVIPGATELVGADPRFVRWAVLHSEPGTKYAYHDYFERGHDDSSTARAIELTSGETPFYIDARWVLTRVYGFSHADTVDLHDRLATTVRTLPFACPEQRAIASGGHVYLIGACPPRSEVRVFDLASGAVSPWFVASRPIDGFAVDGDHLYYVLDDKTLHARSRALGVDTVLLRGFDDAAFVVMDRAAFTCFRGLIKRPFDGTPEVTVAPSCEAVAHDADGVVFAADGRLHAFDRGASLPRLLAGDVDRDFPERFAISPAWVYHVAKDGIRRVPRR